jgi:hypothetical protein
MSDKCDQPAHPSCAEVPSPTRRRPAPAGSGHPAAFAGGLRRVSFVYVRGRPAASKRGAAERGRTRVDVREQASLVLKRKVGGSIPPLPTTFPQVNGLQRLIQVLVGAKTTETTSRRN